MTSETPKAKNVVCTKHPLTSPATVASPDFTPFDILWVSTKMLSGPGEMASAVEAITNKKSVSKFKLNRFSLEKYKILNALKSGNLPSVCGRFNIVHAKIEIGLGSMIG